MKKADTENRYHFVEHMIRLGLFHAWRETRAGRDLTETLLKRSPIYRLTAIWDGRDPPGISESEDLLPVWTDIVCDIEKAFRRYRNDSDAFESAGFKRLWPLAEPRIAEDLAAWPWIPDGFSPVPIPQHQVFGCFAYEWDEKGRGLCFHICNICRPDSLFNDMAARRKELHALVKNAVRAHPSACQIRCNSWLNSFPPFLSLFPPEYPRPDRIAPLGRGYNWWGQFQRRDGGFHEKHGHFFRQEGRFPFAAIDGICSPDSLTRVTRQGASATDYLRIPAI